MMMPKIHLVGQYAFWLQYFSIYSTKISAGYHHLFTYTFNCTFLPPLLSTDFVLINFLIF